MVGGQVLDLLLNSGHSPLMLLQAFHFSEPFIIKIHWIIIIKEDLEAVVIEQLRPNDILNVFIFGVLVFRGDC